MIGAAVRVRDNCAAVLEVVTLRAAPTIGMIAARRLLCLLRHVQILRAAASPAGPSPKGPLARSFFPLAPGVPLQTIHNPVTSSALDDQAAFIGNVGLGISSVVINADLHSLAFGAGPPGLAAALSLMLPALPAVVGRSLLQLPVSGASPELAAAYVVAIERPRLPRVLSAQVLPLRASAAGRVLLAPDSIVFGGSPCVGVMDVRIDRPASRTRAPKDAILLLDWAQLAPSMVRDGADELAARLSHIQPGNPHSLIWGHGAQSSATSLARSMSCSRSRTGSMSVPPTNGMEPAYARKWHWIRTAEVRAKEASMAAQTRRESDPAGFSARRAPSSLAQNVGGDCVRSLEWRAVTGVTPRRASLLSCAL